MSAAAMTNGRAAAAMVAAGFGCFALGVLAVVADGWKGFAQKMIFYRPTGPLSGVTTIAIVLWLAAWWVLAARWKEKTVGMGWVAGMAMMLLGAGLLLTFPPFGDLLLGR